MCNQTTSTTPNPDGTTTITRPTLSMPGDVESGWRWCRRCQGLFHDAAASHGVCVKSPFPPPPPGAMPDVAIGVHDGTASGQYSLYHQRAHGCTQTGWRRCKDCKGLFYGEAGRTGRCPARSVGGHTADASRYEIYTCTRDRTQAGWRWCSKCEGMFYAGNPGSLCPASGTHDGSNSGTYFISHA